VPNLKASAFSTSACRYMEISVLSGEEFTLPDQIPSQHSEVAVLGAVQFDFPISRPNNSVVNTYIRVAPVCAFLSAHRAGFVRASADVNHAWHWQDYPAEFLFHMASKIANKDSFLVAAS
jgi:hypothetical protein